MSSNRKTSEDYTLIIKAQKDRNAFEALYEKYFVRVFQFIYKRIFDKDLSNDLTQQTFLKAMLNIGRYQDKGTPFIAWLFRIASNELNMHFRNQKMNEVELDDRFLSAIADGLHFDETENVFNAMIDALNDLSEAESSLIELRFYDQNSFAEIAAIIGTSEANAKMKLYRLLDRLKTHIESRLSKS